MSSSYSAPRAVFWRRLWAFLNYRTKIYLTWRELMALSIGGLALAWSAIRAWAGIELLGPAAVYLFLLGFASDLHPLLDALRRLYYWFWKPEQVGARVNRQAPALLIVVAAAAVGLGLATQDPRLALLYGILVLSAAIAIYLIHEHETANGQVSLAEVAGRLPVADILPDGQVLAQDGTPSRVAILTQGKSGYKPALAPVDAANILTKFLAFLAQYEPGGAGLPLKFFWVSDYHLGQLDVDHTGALSDEYVAGLRGLVESSAQRARVILSGIIYPPQVEERLAEWLAPLDLGLSPLGSFAAEAFVRHLLCGESFMSQVQEANLTGMVSLNRLAGSLPRGFRPTQLSFTEHLAADGHLADVFQINTPFSEARESLWRALQAADGFLCLELQPLARAETASEYRGKLLAARVPGLGRSEEAREFRDILNRLEDRRSLEYLFQTRTCLVLEGADERELRTNRALAESFLMALDWTPLNGRSLEESLPHWLPILSQAPSSDPFAQIVDWIAKPFDSPSPRLLSEQLVQALHHEEGSDIHLADAKGRILLGRSVTPGKEGMRYADFRADTGPMLLVSDQGGGKSSTLIVWFILRLQLLNYKIIAINLKYSNRMQIAMARTAGVVVHPSNDMAGFESQVRAALASSRPVLYQPIKGTRPHAIADDPCLLSFVRILYEEWLPTRDSPAALVIDEIHRLMPKDQALSQNASQVASLVSEAFKDWAERKLVIAAATQTLRDLYGSNLGLALQKFRSNVYFQVGPEDREALVEKGYAATLIDLIIGERRRPRGYGVLVMPDGFYTTIKIMVTPEEREIIQRLDVEETADVTPQLAFR